MVLQNLNNNALTFINFQANFNRNINPVVIFYDIGDNAELIKESDLTNQKEEDLFDN